MKTNRFLPLLCLALVAFHTLAADNPVTEIESLTAQWSSLENQRSSLQASWRSEEPVLEQQLSLLERERDILTASLEETVQQLDVVEERRLELLGEQTRFEQEQLAMEDALRTALIEVRGLHPQLPPPLGNSWDEHLPRLMNEQLSTSERLQSLLEMLTALDDFRRMITVTESVMTMADGNEYLISQIYLGLSTGWYVSADGRFAGSGHPSASGWVWQPETDAVSIGNMLAILERRRNAGLVTLPAGEGTD